MDPFSISVGVLAIINACGKSGQLLIKLYNDHQTAEADVAATLLKLETVWRETEMQMDFLRDIWPSLDAGFQATQILLLSTLEGKLQEAIKLLDGVIGAESDPGGFTNLLMKKGSLQKKKYVASVKSSLDKTLSELLEWRSLFDPTWFLISRVSKTDVDRALQSRSKSGPVKLLAMLRKSVQELDIDADAGVPLSRPMSTRDFLGDRIPITYSTVCVAPVEGRLQHGIVETMLVNADMDANATQRRVIALSRVLSRADPTTFGLLRCCGIIDKIDRLELVLEIPDGLQQPRCLRAMLNGSKPSSNIRVELAKQLAKSVFYVHALGFVHKNIRPETVLVFNNRGRNSLFLCGFEFFRGAKDDTFEFGDGLPERDLYRQPLRQGDGPEQRSVMQHDIYSLGLCLLELGLWKPFVRAVEGKTVVDFQQHEDNNNNHARQKAWSIKKQILVATEELLAQSMGQRFKDVVQQCLTCLDNDTTWQHDEGSEVPDTGIGLEFIEKVLLPLHEIVI